MALLLYGSGVWFACDIALQRRSRRAGHGQFPAWATVALEVVRHLNERGQVLLCLLRVQWEVGASVSVGMGGGCEFGGWECGVGVSVGQCGAVWGVAGGVRMVGCGVG